MHDKGLFIHIKERTINDNTQGAEIFRAASQVLAKLEIPPKYHSAALKEAWVNFGHQSIEKTITEWWAEHPKPDPAEECYCPICGKFDVSLIFGLHHCEEKEIKSAQKKLTRADKPKNPLYGDILADGFHMMNPEQ